MSSRRHVRYSPLAVDEDDDYHGGRRFDPRFDYSPKAFDRVPWKSIVLAVFLLCLGCLLLFLSFFIFGAYGRREVTGIWPSSPRNSYFPSRFLRDSDSILFLEGC